MSWTTPRTWADGETPDQTIMDAHIGANINNFDQHRHTGAAGDGAKLIGDFSSGAYDTDRIFTSAKVTYGRSGFSALAFGYDSTHKWIYRAMTFSAHSGWIPVINPVVPELDPVCSFILAATAADDGYYIRFGFNDDPTAFTSGDPTNGAFFRSVSAQNFYAVTRAGGVETQTDLGFARSTTPVGLRIALTTGQAQFFVDGELVATHADATVPAATTVLRCSLGLAVFAGVHQIRLGPEIAMHWKQRA